LKRGDNGQQVYVVCEIPSHAILAKEFAARFDGFSIGGNVLTPFTLGVDGAAFPLTRPDRPCHNPSRQPKGRSRKMTPPKQMTSFRIMLSTEAS
jgi:hypothetical protein